MSQLVCGGCRTLLVYVRGASSVQCSCCHTVNLSMETGQVAHINCGGCGMTLMYAFGAQSVKCAICQFVSNVSVGQTRMPLPLQRPPYSAPPPPQPQTVSCISIYPHKSLYILYIPIIPISPIIKPRLHRLITGDADVWCAANGSGGEPDDNG